jgi:hypothetical protein
MKKRVLLLLTLGGALAACIFDSGGDYQGGGHRGDVQTADTASNASSSSSATSTSSSSSKPDSGATGAIRDAGTDG